MEIRIALLGRNLSLKGKNYKLLVQGCEVFLDTYFYEGAADESGAVVGHVMVEQMGYN